MPHPRETGSLHGGFTIVRLDHAYLLIRALNTSDRYAGQIILRIAYGIEVLDNDDPFIIEAEKGMHAMAVAARPGAFLVDTWPSLRYVPSWVPGAGFKTWAKEANKSATAMRDAPLKFVEKAMVCSFSQPSSVLTYLAKGRRNRKTFCRVENSCRA